MRPYMREIREAPSREAGFTLTEMLVTMLILVLASTLLATGVPVAIDTYRKTVRSANAQVALSTTVTALRKELGLVQRVHVEGDKVYYESSDEGCALRIENADEAAGGRGLCKQYLTGVMGDGAQDPVDGLSEDGEPVRLISEATVTDELMVAYDGATLGDGTIHLSNLHVSDVAGNRLAGIDELVIMTRFRDR